eukprot:g29950.t1
MTDQKALLPKTRGSFLGLLLLFTTLACLVTASWAVKWLDRTRSLALYGTLLGLLPGALHSRYSRTAEAPRRSLRYCLVLLITLLGFAAPLDFQQVPHQTIIRWVDALSCAGITVVAALCMKLEHPPSNYVRHAVWAIFGSWLLITLLASTVFFPREYHTLLQHAAWHLEGIDFMWIAWLMADRITEITDRPSYTFSNSGKIIRIAAVCFHFRTLLAVRPRVTV